MLQIELEGDESRGEEFGYRHSHTMTKDPSLQNGGSFSPIFVVGCPRSGTTLVSQILNSHSRIAMYHETNYYLLFRSSLRFYGDLRRPFHLKRLVADLLETVRAQGVQPPEMRQFQKSLVAPTFEGVLATLLLLYARQEGKLRGGEKTPRHYLFLSEILEKFPASPAIFVIRDPRDTVLSLKTRFGHTVEGGAHLWNEAYESYLRHAPRVLKVRYENLVENAEEGAAALCRFVGEEYEPGVLRFFERLPAPIRNRPDLRGSRLDQPVGKDAVGTFRQMAPAEIELIETICAKGMTEMGYEFTSARQAVIVERPAPGFLRQMFERLRYYGFNRVRWQRGWLRWKMAIRVRAHYLLSLGPLRSASS